MPAPAAPRSVRRDAVRNLGELARAATVAFHRDGLQVPMSAIAAEAGVGVGTLYRHFSGREALLGYLTHSSFERVLANARTAERECTSAVDSLRRFVEAAIVQRNDLVLPLHGGPPVTAPETRALRAEVHTTLRRIIAAGIEAGELRPGLRATDVVVFGALVAQPRAADPDWDATCRRLLDAYLAGLSR